uniref:ABC transmembrane type-1 domain-containing protein n=1 Tax=Electrophorus electricus TaxID=8005 RepID=A0AAY5F2H2_ELEEL
MYNCSRLWDEEVERVGTEKASLVSVVMRFQRTRMIVSFFVSVLFTFGVKLANCSCLPNACLCNLHLCFLQSIVMYEILKYAFFASLMWAMNMRTAIRLKSAFSMLAFHKIISLRTFGSVTVGEMINVLTSDSYRMFEAVIFGTFLLCIPVLLIVCITYACYILGYTALLGWVFFFPFLLETYLCVCALTDKRVRTMNEVLTCIKLIKMYAWEESFEKKITDIRKSEKSLLEKAGYVQSVNSSLTAIVPTLATIFTFIAHTALRLPLEPSVAYTIIAVFNSMRMSMGLLPFSVKALAEAKVALTRLKVCPYSTRLFF